MASKHQGAPRDSGSTTVLVFVTHDIAFPQVASGLDFDEFQQDVTGIFEAVDGPERDVGGLIFRCPST